MVRKRRTGRLDYGVVVDVCSRTATTHRSRLWLTTMLSKSGIAYLGAPLGHPLESRTVRLASLEDMNLLLLILYGEVVDADDMCLRSTPQQQHYVSPAVVQAIQIAQQGKQPSPPPSPIMPSPYSNESIKRYLDLMNQHHSKINRALKTAADNAL